MSDIKTSYKKLRGSAFFSSNRLYRGPDHLLSIRNNLFSEEYLRFYYKDIQTIITRKTPTDKILSICFSFFLFLFLIFALMLTGGWSVFFFVLSGIFFIPLVINLLKGPTSISYIQTPIQTVKLSCIRRLKNAEKAIAQLKPLIEQNQGLLAEEQIKNINRRYEDTGLPSDTSMNTPKITLKHENGKFHLSVFSFLILSAVLIVIDIFYQHMALSIISGLIFLIMIVLLIIALIRQVGSDLYMSIKIYSWSIIGYICLNATFSYVFLLMSIIKNPEKAGNQWELLKHLSLISPLDNSFAFALSIFFLMYTLIIGILGILATLKFRSLYKSNQYLSVSSNEDSVSAGLGNE